MDELYFLKLKKKKFLMYVVLHNFFPLLFYSINLICVSISIIVFLNKNYFNKQI